MNVLISYLSLYTNSLERTYLTNGLCSVEAISAPQTNVPVLKMLCQRLGDSGEAPDKVITILSYKAENEPSKADPNVTAYEYFRSVVEEAAGSADIVCPVREYSDENTLRETGAVIRELCSHLSPDDRIYIDTSGGARTAANMLQLLAKILEYKGYRLAGSFYSNINGKVFAIETTKDFDQLTMLADAVNEFVHTGKSEQLSGCFVNDDHEEITELLKCMDEFTDRIQLCNVSELDDTLTKMRSCIEKVRKIESDETKIVILGTLLPVIENKFFKSGSDSIDYCSMIKWCLENGLVQQAVTIYIEKIPKFIFDNQILICDKEYYREVKKKYKNDPLRQNTDAVIFYDEFMDSVSFADKNDVNRLKNALSKKFKEYDKSFKYDPDLKKYMDIFFDIQRNSRSQDFREYMSNLKNYSGTGSSEFERKLAEYAVNGGYKSFGKFINNLCNNESGLAELIGGKNDKKPTFDKKLFTAENITLKNYTSEGVTVNKKTSINDLRRIMFDYIYVKSVRNQINHASDEENLSEPQKDILEKRGYNVREFTIRVITEIINSSVKLIENTALKVMKG